LDNATLYTLICNLFFPVLGLLIWGGSWLFGNLHQNKLLLKLDTEEKALAGTV